MKRLIIIPLLLILGCASQAYKVHPGAGGYVSGTPTPLQLTISQSYDTLVGADAVIQQTRSDFLANKFPSSSMASIRVAFNGLVNAYDIAQSAWLAFNQQATTNPSASQAALAAALAGVNAAITNLSKAKGAQ